MDATELQSFFDLGNSNKRNDPASIGEKGHGTKVFFNCTQISVVTIKNGTLLTAEMSQPFATLHDGKLPTAEVKEAKTPDTLIVIKGFNNNQGELFTHDRLRDYVKWFTKFGSYESKFGLSAHLTLLQIYLKMFRKPPSSPSASR